MANILDMEYDMIEIAYDTGADYEMVNNFCYICHELLGYTWDETKKIVRGLVSL